MYIGKNSMETSAMSMDGDDDDYEDDGDDDDDDLM